MNRINITTLCIVVLVIFAISCGSLGIDFNGSSATQTPTNSDESNVQATVTSAVEEINSSVSSSSSASAGTVSSLVANTSHLAYATLIKRFQCEDEAQSSETFSCSSAEGTLSRAVTFTDCALGNAKFPDTVLTGGFTNTVVYGGPGFCGDGNYFIFSKMVMGTAEGDAQHTHQTADDGMVMTFTNNKDKEVTRTRTATRSVTYTDPVDADKDGNAESVTATVDLDVEIDRTVDGVSVHDLTITHMDGTFAALDENGDAITVTVTKPVKTITIDEDTYKPTQVTIISGHKIVDHNIADIRVVFGVGDDGLTHTVGTCGPQDGTITFTAYAIEEDDTIGQQVGTGSIVYADGAVSSATYEGTSFNVYTRPCE
ncbi:MAG: hypothetical protein ABII18_11120 [bacterium]|nr:hypothetical protein [bacterium]MBU1918418.1 hypothetical protein [bacterium]